MYRLRMGKAVYRMSVLDSLRKGLGFVMMSMGISSPKKKTKPAPKPAPAPPKN
jgi:hypothetical protein